MKQNLGTADRVLRIIAALAIVVLYFADQISGTAAIILGVVAVMLAVTSFVGFCPAYWPLKLSTKKQPKTVS